MLYDCFFKIIKDRLSKVSHNPNGQLDQLMFPDDALCYLIKPQSKESLKSLELRRAAWLEDYLYLPSHITFNAREAIIKKYGEQALYIEKDVSEFKVMNDY